MARCPRGSNRPVLSLHLNAGIRRTGAADDRGHHRQRITIPILLLLTTIGGSIWCLRQRPTGIGLENMQPSAVTHTGSSEHMHRRVRKPVFSPPIDIIVIILIFMRVTGDVM